MFICDKNILFLLKITLIKLTTVKEHLSQKQGKFIIYSIDYIDIEKFFYILNTYY